MSASDRSLHLIISVEAAAALTDRGGEQGKRSTSSLGWA